MDVHMGCALAVTGAHRSDGPQDPAEYIFFTWVGCGQGPSGYGLRVGDAYRRWPAEAGRTSAAWSLRRSLTSVHRLSLSPIVSPCDCKIQSMQTSPTDRPLSLVNWVGLRRARLGRLGGRLPPHRWLGEPLYRAACRAACGGGGGIGRTLALLSSVLVWSSRGKSRNPQQGVGRWRGEAWGGNGGSQGRGDSGC